MKNEELNIQSAIMTYLKLNGILCYSVPNGTHIKNIATRTLMKRSGVLSGVSDIHIILYNRVVFVEVKTKTGKQSGNQKWFERSVKKQGHEYYVWRDVQDAIDFMKKLKYL